MRPVSSGSTRMVRLPLFQSRATRPLSPGFEFQGFFVQRGVVATEVVDQPVEEISNGALTGLNPHVAWDNRTRDDPADPFYVGGEGVPDHDCHRC